MALFFGSGTKLFITFLSLRFSDMRRETQFLTILTFPSDPTTRSTLPQTTGLPSASSKNQLLSSSVESQLFHSEFKSQLTVFFFKFPNPQCFWAWRHSYSPVSFPIWGFYCDISDCHIHSARAWTPALNVCT